jgi:hypothetical protein
VNGNKQVGLGLVGYFRALVQFDKHIGFAGVNNVYVGKILCDQIAQLQGNLQGYIFLVGFTGPACSGVFSSMPCINYHSFNRKVVIRTRLMYQEQQRYKQYAFKSHVLDFYF